MSNHWIQTVSGLRFDLIDVESNEVRIEDIAHALAHVNRFTGHTHDPYNVAQHSVLVCDLLRIWYPNEDPKLHLLGLLHDASEAYLGDVSRPLKVLLPQYAAIEWRVEWLISKVFELAPKRHHHMVKVADDAVLVAEAYDLMQPFAADWKLPRGRSHLIELIKPWSPFQARMEFMERYAQLTGK